MESLNSKELKSFLLCLVSKIDNNFSIQLILGRFLLFCSSGEPGLQDIMDPAHIVIAFEGPTEWVLGGFVHCNPSRTLFRHMVSFFLAVHVLFRKIAALVLEIHAIHGKYLREYACVNLFLQLV